jgi:hypothetical protein
MLEGLHDLVLNAKSGSRRSRNELHLEQRLLA